MREQLEKEKAIGERYGRAWTDLVEPFIKRKHEELYQLFRDTDSTRQETLYSIKMQSLALEGLSAEFQHYMTTGKLAIETLEKDK